MKKTTAAVAKAMEVDKYAYRPSIDIDEKMYPKIKDLKIDQVVNLELKVKITSIHRHRYDGGKLSVTGEIQNAKSESIQDTESDV